MSRKRYRCSSFLSCFPCLNTQPAVDSCKNDTRLANASAKDIPNACPESQSSSSANTAANSNACLTAAMEGDDEIRHDPQTFTSASAPPFQVSTSHDVSSSSAEGASTSAVHCRTSHSPTPQELSLSSFKSIEERPRILKLPILRVLQMYGCDSLKRLPEDLGSLRSLEEISLSSCKSIEELPRSISKLPILRVLQMDGCYSLKRLPEDFGSLGSLQELNLSSCKSIEELPRSISKLPILRVLKMDGCDGLKRLPDDFGSLGSLRELSLSSCKSIEELPESTSNLRFLKTLKMRACENLKHLPVDFESMDSLQILDLHYCANLLVFPRNFVKFLELKPFDDEVYDYLQYESYKDAFLDVCLFFKAWNWDSVADIVGKSELDLLEKRALVFKDSNMNVKVHEVILKIGSKRVEETRFNFSNASTSEIEEFLKKDISQIKGLWFDEYKDRLYIPAIKLDSLSDSLKILRLGNFEVKGKCDKTFEKLVFFQGNVSHLPFNISQMPSSLKHMELDGKGHSHVFKISPSDFRELRNLRILRLVNFAGLEKLPEELAEIIHELRELCLSYCSSIEELPTSILKLQHLRVLEMYHCYSLRRLPQDFGSLTFLQELALSFCQHIEELPESTSNLQSLQKLKMKGCENLKYLPKEFESLISLQVLELQYCDSLKVLPRNFEKFQKLKPFDGDVYAFLPESCKAPFFDICSFFNGWNWDSVADIVEETNLAELEEKALVSKDSNMTVRVHDDPLIIYRKKAERTRFNFTNASTSQIEEFIEKDIPGVEGLWLDDYKDPLYIPAVKLNSMSDSLRILRFGNSVKVQGECVQRFEKLVYFQGKVPHLPFNISQMPSLRHMELDGKGHSNVFKISSKDIQQLRNLRILRLINFVGLKKLPRELGHILHELRELTLSYCTSIEELPTSISKLQHLRVLEMYHCYSLRRLPQDIGSLTFLQELALSFCKHIEELPESTSNLQSLKKLKMKGCENLKYLPKEFESLNSLQVLELQYCDSLKVLPRNFEKFQKLKPFDEGVYESWRDAYFDICSFFNGWNWDSVADIVEESILAELEEKELVSKDSNMTVRVHDNTSLHDDTWILCRNRAERTRLNFTNASTSQIEEFIEKDIPGIESLWLDDYKDPLYIPAIKLNSMSDSLRILRFGNSVKVQGECVQRFQRLVYFQGKVPHLPFNISQMPSLRHLELDGKGHSNVLKISSKDIQQLGNLRILRLINFVGLKKLPQELGHILHELRELTLSYCTSMKKVPRSISKLQHLRVLKMDSCYNLTRLPQDFGSLSSLQELTLSFCTSMKEVPTSISKLSCLRVLKMDCCYNLLRLPQDFGSLTSLQELTLSCCIQMEELPSSISELQNLRVLKADYCFSLKKWPNVALLNSLPESFCKGHVKEEL